MSKPVEVKKKRYWVFFLVAAALITAISSLSQAANLNIQKTYLANGSVGVSVCDTNSTKMGVGVDVCANTTNYPQDFYVQGVSNFSAQGYMLNSPICTSANGMCLGGGGAPTTAQYVTLALDGTLTAERVLTPGAGILMVDTGANGNIYVNTSATACTAGNYSYWSGSAWLCRADQNSGTSYTAGVGLNITGGSVFNLNVSEAAACTNSVTSKLYWDSTNNTLICGSDQNNNYLAGNGLSLGGGSFSINSPTCAATERSSWNGSAWNCVSTNFGSSNLTYADIYSQGNWSGNYSLFTPTSGLVAELGNWSADKPSYTPLSTLYAQGNWTGNISLYLTAANTKILTDSLNSTKAGTGSSTGCTYGIANYTLYNTTMAVTCAAQQGTGSVTSITGATNGSTSFTVTPQTAITTSGTLTFTVLNASSTIDGLLKATDWVNFNAKGVSNIIAISGTSGILVSNGTATNISANATTCVAGQASSYDGSRFNCVAVGAGSGSGNVTASNGSVNWPAVFTNGSNIDAQLLWGNYLIPSSIGTTLINISNAGGSGQVLSQNSSGGLTWITSSGSGNITGGLVSSYLAVADSVSDIVNSSVWQNSTQTNFTTDVSITSVGGATPGGDLYGLAGNIMAESNFTVQQGNYLNASGYVIPNGERAYWTTLSCEFLLSTNAASQCPGLVGSAISSGTSNVITGTPDHPGIMDLRDSTTANGGYKIVTEITAFLINGSENSTFVLNMVGGSGHVAGDTTARLGFFDTATSANPTDGCWLDFDSNATANKLYGKCDSNSVQTITASSYSFVNNTWYTATMDINQNANNVVYSLYSVTGSLLWTDNVTSMIPTNASRETGWGAIATQSTTDAGASLIDLDYMSLRIGRRLNR